jgi:pilus assembly protein CpaE
MAQENEKRVVTFLLVSPDAAIRRELTLHFEKQAEIQSACIEAESLSRGYDLVIARRPSAAVVDLRDNPIETLQVVARMHEQAPESKIIGIYNPLQLPVNVDQSELFLEGIRNGVFDFLRLPIVAEDALRIFDRVARPAAAPAPKDSNGRQGRVIGFFSNKGGVGKTTLASNVAVALARYFPDQVAVVDASLEIGNVRDYFNVEPQYSLFDAVAAKDRLDRDLLMGIMAYHKPTQVAILDTPRKLEQTAHISDEDITQVLLSMRNAFRYVLVDTLPIFNAVNLAVGDLSDYIVIMTEAIVPTVKGTRDLLAMLAEAGYPQERIRVVLNRYTRFSGNVDAQWVAQSLKRPIDYVLPYDKALHEHANLGKPYLSSKPQTRMAEQIERLAADVGGLTVPPRRSLLRRLLPF